MYSQVLNAFVMIKECGAKKILITCVESSGVCDSKVCVKMGSNAHIEKLLKINLRILKAFSWGAQVCINKHM